MTFTKGEWKVVVSRVTGGDFYSVVSNYRKHQYEVAKILYVPEDKANAHLIAAAPDMYEALLDVTMAYQRGFKIEQARAYNKARKVLDKATGGETQ